MPDRIHARAERARLPDFCAAPALLSLLLLCALTVLVMWLAPGTTLTLRGFSTSMVFAVWLGVINGVALCKLRPLLQRLPGLFAYSGAWLLMVLNVVIGSAVVIWIDHTMGIGLTPYSTPRFVLGNAAVAALIGAALLRYFYVLALWQERLAAVSRAQVQALQARIRPHFLFNSMNTVAALVRVDPDAAERTIEDLSELFRAALGAEGGGTLGEELSLVDRYLAIEQWRLGDRLRIEHDLQDLPLALPLPRLLLQPLVENAVRHGVQPRRDGGTVSLRGRRVGDLVEIVISNPLSDTDSSEPGHGLGLDSVRQRLSYHFGTRGRLTQHTDAGMFRVTVQLPFDDTPDAHPDR